MAVRAKDAIRIARGLIGTPYSELDCINLIKKVIRTAPGGDKTYTTAGTNALWDSFNMSAKYKDLTWRQAGLTGALGGMLAFKADGEDVHHVGIVTDEGTVVHSSSTQGGRGVVETPLTAREGWTHLAVHRYIQTQEEANPMDKIYSALVVTQKDPLNVRDYPKTGRIVGRVPKGMIVGVLREDADGWMQIAYNELEGYVDGRYLVEAGEDAEGDEDDAEPPGNVIISPKIVIIDDAGNRFEPAGGWRTYVDGAD